jgi:hypothetical protein
MVLRKAWLQSVSKSGYPRPFISDSTIRFEMSIFGAIMNYAVKKRYVPASQRFDERPKLKTMRRDEFTLEEYRKLHTVGRKRRTSACAFAVAPTSIEPTLPSTHSTQGRPSQTLVSGSALRSNPMVQPQSFPATTDCPK